MGMACPKAAGLTWRFGIWLLCVTLYGLPFVLFEDSAGWVEAYVTKQNSFIVLKTRDSGTFIGTTEPGNATAAVDDGSRVYYAFKGIPYARAPGGTLRWQEPQVLDVKSGPMDTTKYRSICSQWSQTEGGVRGSQDCLYLNIFTPRLNFAPIRSTDADEPSPYDDDPRTTFRTLPVLVHIHPSDFLFGSSSGSSPDRFSHEDVLLVTLNYRLGAFGFLSNGLDNAGLLDQIAGLKWLRKNVHRFGGDPTRITVFGDVSPLLASPLASDLFQGAIQMGSSGSIFTPGFTNPDPAEYFQRLLKEAGCTTEDCMRLKPAEDLINAQQKLLAFSTYPRGAAVAVEGNSSTPGDALFPENPEELLRTEEFSKRRVPILIGVNAAEGFRHFREFYRKTKETTEDAVKEDLHVALKAIFPVLLQHKEVFTEVWNFYFGNGTNNSSAPLDLQSDDFMLHMLNLFGDATTYSAHWELLQILSEKKSLVFNYVFDYNLNKIKTQLAAEAYEPNHFFPWEEEYFLLSSENETRADFTEADETISKTMVKIWTSFASYKTPKNAISKLPNWSKWQRFSLNADNSNATTFYHITSTGSVMAEGFREKEIQFWLKSVPEAHERAEERLAGTETEESSTMFLAVLCALALIFIILILIVVFITCKMI